MKLKRITLKDKYLFVDEMGGTPQFEITMDQYHAILIEWIQNHCNLKLEMKP